MSNVQLLPGGSDTRPCRADGGHIAGVPSTVNDHRRTNATNRQTGSVEVAVAPVEFGACRGLKTRKISAPRV